MAAEGKEGLGMSLTKKLFPILILIIIFQKPYWSQAEEKGSALEIVKKSQQAFFYPGEDMKTRVRMTLINKEGQQRLRALTMLRKNYKEGNQKYFIYFHNPGDVRGTSFMVFKYPGKDDDRWIFIPAINLVNRIAAKDARSSFVGSDFTYEDVSGRDIEADDHFLLKEEKLDGKDCYVIESKSRTEAEYTRKVSWIEKASFIPLKEEYYDIQGALYKVFTADEVKDVQGLPTITKRTMKNVKTGHRTGVVFEEVTYKIGITDDLFTERYLRKPPEKWIR